MSFVYKLKIINRFEKTVQYITKKLRILQKYDIIP